MDFNAKDFGFLGWNNSAGHDKIWGFIKTSQGVFSFWGRRGKSLSFKEYTSVWDAEAVANKKEDSGYKRQFNTEVLPPDFEGQLMMACLGKVKFSA
jgi:hypothetical protein